MVIVTGISYRTESFWGRRGVKRVMRWDMAITDRAIDQCFSDLKATCGGVRNDYFGLLYLIQEFDLERERAVPQVAFGGNDYGVDGFHFDKEKRNLYLYQFKWSNSHALYNEWLNRLIDSGME